ncbi:MAG: efflux RND transporter periplasmic adaptor subunit [Pseudomonadota bacterium]
MGIIALLAIGAVCLELYLQGPAANGARAVPLSPAAASSSAQAMLDLNEEQAASVKIAPVGSATFTPEVGAVGNIDFNQNLLVQVFTPYQGRIINAFPNIGDKVEKGQVLFTVDSPDLLNSESTLIAAAGVLKLQNITLKRAQQMKAFGGASQQAVDQSTSDQQTAQSALKTARDAVRMFGKTDAEIDSIIAGRRADPVLVIKSPIDGYVTTRTASPGLLVQPGNAPPVYTVADLSTMWMFANVVESDAPLLAVGQHVAAHVVALPNKVFDGRILVLGPNVDPNSRRVFVRMEVSDPEHLLRAGMLANFTIRVGLSRKAVAVPEAAVVREGDGTMTAWVTEDDRRFIRRTLKIGAVQNGYDEILDGLKQDEKVVVDGAVFLSNAYDTAGNATD